jgi:hypothetical protein
MLEFPRENGLQQMANLSEARIKGNGNKIPSREIAAPMTTSRRVDHCGDCKSIIFANKAMFRTKKCIALSRFGDGVGGFRLSMLGTVRQVGG